MSRASSGLLRGFPLLQRVITALLAGLLLVSGCAVGLRGTGNYNVAPDGWAMFRNSSSGYVSAQGDLARPIGLIWETKFRGKLRATPAVSEGLGILPSLDRKIYFFDPATGDEKGMIRTRSSTSSSPALAGYHLYTASEKGDGRLRCFDLKTGRSVWERDLGDVVAPITVHHESLLIGNHAGTLYSLDRLTGEIEWAHQTGGPIMGAAAVADGKAFVASSEGVVCCLDIADGDLIWRFDAREAVFTAPAIGKYCYFGSIDRHLYALDPATGDSVWSFKTGGQIFSSPIVDEHAVYFGSNDGCMYAVRNDTGRLVWKVQTDAIVNGSALVLSDAVVFGSGDRYVYFVDKLTGERFFKYQTDGQIVSSPAYFRGRIYVASTGRRLYCFSSEVSDSAINAGTAPE